jgi:hypothetical protein
MAYLVPPDFDPDTAKWCRDIVRCVKGILQGKTNNTGLITLKANAGSTLIELASGRLGEETVILFDPLTANAAADLYGGAMYVTSGNRDVLGNAFTITHPNNANADKRFRYTLIG